MSSPAASPWTALVKSATRRSDDHLRHRLRVHRGLSRSQGLLRGLSAAAAAVALVACGPPSSGSSSAPTTQPPLHEELRPRPQALPDPSRTPGATNPAVTQFTLVSTICVRGYTKTIRPPASYTDQLKHQQLVSGYGSQGDSNPADYEEDHLIPLEVGGNPTDPRNLWPQPRNTAYGAAAKDKVENSVHASVCAGQMTLQQGQAVFVPNWIAGARSAGLLP